MAGEGGGMEGTRRRDGQIKRTERRGDKEENKDTGGNSRSCLEVKRRWPRCGEQMVAVTLDGGSIDLLRR